MPDLKGAAVLFSQMTPPDGTEDRFNRWYFDHHMPNHVYGVPGFVSGQRYRDDSRYLAVYELESPATLADPEYRKRKYTPDPPTRDMLSSVTGFTRYIGEEIGFRVREDCDDPLSVSDILAGFFAVSYEAAFVEWCEAEYASALSRDAGWRMTRHLRIVDANPEPFTHMVLHYIDEEPGVRSSAMERCCRLLRDSGQARHAVRYRRFGKRYHKGESAAADFVPEP